MRHPKTLIEFMQLYPTEDECRQAIFEHRWPHGFSCRRCGHERARHLRGRGLFECASCHYQGSLTAGTILSYTRTELRKWFLAVWLSASTKKAPSAAEHSRQLGVTVKTAWLMRRKSAHAMARREGEFLRRGIVELDEGFIGGKRSRPARRGRRHPGKTMVASAAEQTPGGGLRGAHLRVVTDASAASLSAAAHVTIAAGSVVQTDGWSGYVGLGAPGTAIFPACCPQALTSISGCPGRTSCTRALQLQAFVGPPTSSTASAPRTYRPTSTSTATGSIAATSARTSSGACSIAACSTRTRRPIRCSQLPERRGWACRGVSSSPLH